MSQIKEEIERWLKNHPHTPFTLIGVDESGGYDFKLEPDVLLWKLYVDDETGKPVVPTPSAQPSSSASSCQPSLKHRLT
jgi:hypothetical protein